MESIQPKMIRIREVLHIEPFKILCRWSNEDVRISDLTQDIARWQESSDLLLAQLADPVKFKTAFVQSGTIAFSGVLVDAGNMGLQPVDLDPDVLFDTSKKVGQFLDVPVS